MIHLAKPFLGCTAYQWSSSFKFVFTSSTYTPAMFTHPAIPLSFSTAMFLPLQHPPSQCTTPFPSFLYITHLSQVSGPSSSSPCLDFNTLNLTNTIGEFSYTPFTNYTAASPSCPYTPPDNDISPQLFTTSVLASSTYCPSSVHSVPYTSVPTLITSTPSLPRHYYLFRSKDPEVKGL
jgi:hypothetical protein